MVTYARDCDPDKDIYAVKVTFGKAEPHRNYFGDSIPVYLDGQKIGALVMWEGTDSAHKNWWTTDAQLANSLRGRRTPDRGTLGEMMQRVKDFYGET